MLPKYSYLMLNEAYGDAKKGHAIRTAARRHSIPESTLRARLKSSKGMQGTRGAPTLFSRKQEEELAGHSVAMAHLGYGFTRWQLLEIAQGMCEVTGRSVQPTKHWFYGFLNRFPELKMLHPKKREKSRDDAVTDETLACYFKELKSLMDKYDLLDKPTQIWNVDESGISLDHTPPKILARSGTNPHAVTSGKSANTTIIAAGSALGETIPPYIIYKGERLTKEMTSNGVEGAQYRLSPTGWSNTILFLDFFKTHFLKNVTARPCLLLYDGHSTHINTDIIEAARAADVHLFVLPPHSSHCLQPLDVSVFSPFKKSLNTEFHKYLHAHPNNIVTKELLPQVINKTYRSAMTVTNIMSGFRKAGIFPFTPSAPSVSPPTITKTSETTTVTVTRKERKDNRLVKILFQNKAESFQEAKDTVVPKKKRKTFIPPYGAPITEDVYYVAKKQQQQQKNRPSSKNDSNPEQLPPRRAPLSVFTPPFLENTENITTKGVSEPIKVSEKKKNPGKGPHHNSKRGKNAAPKEKKLPTLIDEEDEEDSEVCVVCGKFQPDGFTIRSHLTFVQWGQCVSCTKWVHLSFCTEVEVLTDEDMFTCPNCASEQ